ncbi:hypothetical protein GCM10009788_30230 [Nocardioides humi]|uniref:Ribonuclease VapC n=1 Tax=Nocardioides humi TaxID=449461 RepID=A0ABN2AQ07_9ACTN
MLLYGFGEAHRWRLPSQALVQAAAAGEVAVHVSVEALQEFLHHRMRRCPRSLALQQAERVATVTRAHDFDHVIWDRALRLVESTPIRGRDAIHAATALEHGFAEIVTTDADFVVVPGLTPVAPDQLGL